MFYIEIFKDKKKQWRIRIKAVNGRIIMNSEAYYSKCSMMRTVNDLVEYHRFQIKDSGA